MRCLNFVSVAFKLIYDVNPYGSNANLYILPSLHRAPGLSRAFSNMLDVPQAYSSLMTPLDLAFMTVLISPTGISGMGSSMMATVSASKK